MEVQRRRVREGRQRLFRRRRQHRERRPVVPERDAEVRLAFGERVVDARGHQRVERGRAELLRRLAVVRVDPAQRRRLVRRRVDDDLGPRVGRARAARQELGALRGQRGPRDVARVERQRKEPPGVRVRDDGQLVETVAPRVGELLRRLRFLAQHPAEKARERLAELRRGGELQRQALGKRRDRRRRRRYRLARRVDEDGAPHRRERLVANPVDRRPADHYERVRRRRREAPRAEPASGLLEDLGEDGHGGPVVVGGDRRDPPRDFLAADLGDDRF
mmetsp:Transcript_26295/g.81878  ORF Transcript_26295/g.81878 Transcript_26295/m.81878 type:complete len:276 (-) Transcript_26295:156-983(-)